MNVSIALKGTHFWFLFVFTAAGVVQCVGRKTSPRTSTIVQIIFYSWSFEISMNILRNQKYLIGLDSYSRQVFNYLDLILIYISPWIDCLFEIRKIAMLPLAFVAESLQGHWWGFISRNYIVWPIFFLMNVSIALKETHFWFLLYNFSQPRNKGAESTPFYYNAICDWNGFPDSVKGCKKIGEYKKLAKIFLTDCNLNKESSSFAYF